MTYLENRDRHIFNGARTQLREKQGVVQLQVRVQVYKSQGEVPPRRGTEGGIAGTICKASGRLTTTGAVRL